MPKPPKLKTTKTTTTREVCSADDLAAYRSALSARLGLPISRARLAAEAGVTQQAVDDFEKGRRAVPEKVIQAARRLGEKLAPLRELARQTSDIELVFRVMSKMEHPEPGWANDIWIRRLAEDARRELDAEAFRRKDGAALKMKAMQEMIQEKRALRRRLREERKAKRAQGQAGSGKA